jgi:hypothetical protein
MYEKYSKPMRTSVALQFAMLIDEDRKAQQARTTIGSNCFCTGCGIRTKENGLCHQCLVDKMIKEGK